MSTSPALAYHAGGLGDFVLSLPALQRLAASRPGVTWHYWGPRERLALLPGWSPPPAELLRGEGSLWGEHPATDAASWLAGADPVVAFAAAPPPWLPTGPRGLHLQAFSGSPGAAVEWVPRFQASQLDSASVPRMAQPWLPRWRRQVLPLHPGGRLVLHPGSGDRAKNLPLATWHRAAETLGQELGLSPLVLEGPVEQERGVPEEGWPAERCGCSSLDDLLAVLSRASLLLGNDSGVAHLAGLLGIPTVVAFGPSDPARWHPLGPRVEVVRSPRPCAPCCGAPPILCDHHSCLGEITAAAVIATARRLLAVAPGPGGQGIRSGRR